MVSTMNHPRRDDVGTAAAALARSVARMSPELRVSYLTAVRELSHFRFGPSRTDVRHWLVFTADGRLAGVVDRLLVETATRKVRYAAIVLDRHAADDHRPNACGSVLVPIGALRRASNGQTLTLRELTAQVLVTAPRLSARPVTRADEMAALDVYGYEDAAMSSAEFYGDSRFDEELALTP